MPQTIYLGFGTNLGDRLANLKAARDALAPQVVPVVSSPIFETKPWGYTDQPNFLNQALKAHTKLKPQALLKYLKSLEITLGRTPSIRYGPRLIDIDILLYDDLVLQTPELTIPHPRLHERAFVLAPLAAIAPDLVHPVLGRTIRRLLEGVDGSSILEIYDII